jgi:uncharacterized protein YcfL
MVNRHCLLSLMLVFLLITTGCSSNQHYNNFPKLNIDDYDSINVSIDGIEVLASKDRSFIENIIKEINTNKKAFATEMEFEKGPEGLITLKGKEEVEISFFKDTGNSIYGDYYIYTEFKFD